MDWISGIATGISGLVGGISSASAARNNLRAVRETNDMNLRIARETNQANRDLYSQQYQDQVKMWQMQNEYNKPSNEVARLSEAGINPAMAFGDAAQAGSMSVPPAAPMQGAQMDAPVTQYSDTWVNSALAAVGSLGQSFGNLEDVKGKQIDNQLRDQLNFARLDELKAQIDAALESSKLSKEQRSLLEKQGQQLQLANDFLYDSYSDRLKQIDLSNRMSELQQRVMNDQNARDAARLAIEQLSSAKQSQLTDAQIGQIQTMANLAINADWRAGEQHVMDMNLRKLDEAFKRINLPLQEKQAVTQSILLDYQKYHEGLKNASLVNRFVERAFGLGFNDIGHALQSMIRVVK